MQGNGHVELVVCDGPKVATDRPVAGEIEPDLLEGDSALLGGPPHAGNGAPEHSYRWDI